MAWINGPFPAGESDITIYRRPGGLKEKMPVGKRIVGDRGYTGEPETISTRNELDPRELAAFKERVQARHETFNGKLKNFKCLSTKFRHGVEQHKVVFESLCVIVQYEIENGAPLFNAYN